jgi:hypothetical protein
MMQETAQVERYVCGDSSKYAATAWTKKPEERKRALKVFFERSWRALSHWGVVLVVF